jgi:hypothetical protein
MYRSKSKGGLYVETIAKKWEFSILHVNGLCSTNTWKNRRQQHTILKVLFTFRCNWRWIWANFLKVDHYSTLNFPYQTVYTLHQHTMWCDAIWPPCRHSNRINSDTEPHLLLTITVHSSPWHHMLGDLNPHQHCCENLKSHTKLICSTSSHQRNI